MNSLISIYIPRVSITINEQNIKEEFRNLCVDVSRVDFTSIDKKPGFYENYQNVFKSAFIHIKKINNNPIMNEILKNLNNEDSYKFYPRCKKEYWILLKAKNPIPDTLMNNAQIVENCRYLENKIESQEETIKYLKDNLVKILLGEYKIENKEILKDNLFYDNLLDDYDDENQDILLMKRKQEIVREKKNSCNFSISTHSSMPELFSSNSSLQDLDEIYSSDSERRINNSYELCGNR